MSPSSDVEEHQLLNRFSSESAADEFDGDSYSYVSKYNRKSRLSTLRRSLRRCLNFVFFWTPFSIRSRHFAARHRYRSLSRLALCSITVTVLFSCSLFTLTALFWPSYTSPPDHYFTTQRRCKESVRFGRGNPHNEKVFIAASIYDPGGTLAGKDWGQAVIRLIELLGPDNVFLSLYENDPDPGADASLNVLRNQVPCNNSIVSEHLPLEDLPHIRLPSGDNAIKRIAYLAEVRNRALEPIRTNTSTQFDKLLFLNDVIFDPIEAIQLLFSTNIDENSGRAQYSAACAVDFINPFKFYDTFATRDLEGFGIGVPLYPWFTDSGLALSRNDIFAQRDAVRVRSCWGGMVAFQAKWFQQDQVLVDNSFGDLLPLHFRYEEDTFWDASECCLIHADLTYFVHGGKSDINDTGIFMNPYVRVAYDPTTLSWLPYTRRIERLFSPFQSFISHLAGLPTSSSRRLHQPGQRVTQKIWEDESSQSRWLSSKRSYREIERIAKPGGFCGSEGLMIMRERGGEGEKNWLIVPTP